MNEYLFIIIIALCINVNYFIQPFTYFSSFQHGKALHCTEPFYPLNNTNHCFISLQKEYYRYIPVFFAKSSFSRDKFQFSLKLFIFLMFIKESILLVVHIVKGCYFFYYLAFYNPYCSILDIYSK